MQLQILHRLADIELIAAEWQHLAASSPYATVFQSWEWNYSWWLHFGSQPGRTLHLLVWRDSLDGPIIGLAPLMARFWHGLPIRRMTFIGAGSSDYHDILALPGREQDVCSWFSAAISNDVLDLAQLRTQSILRQHCSPSGDAVTNLVADQEVCPFLPLAESWETQLKRFGKKTRSNIAYYRRALTKVFEVEVLQVSDASQVDEEMARLFELHQRRWNQRWLPGVFGSHRVRSFHKEAARRLLGAGMLRLFVLKLDGETQAALYCMSHGDRMCYYQGGFEPTMSKWSLGTLITAHAIETAVNEQRAVFDFLRGDEPYKAKWTQTSQTNLRRLITPRRSVLKPATEFLFRSEVEIERKVKAWLRRRM